MIEVLPHLPTKLQPTPPATIALRNGRSIPLDGGSSSAIPRVMGILNLTPDSFSDGGQFNGVDAAVEGGLELVDQGADLLDLGAESTRPAGKTYGQGGSEISAQEEIDRLLPVLEALRPQTSVPISIDTRKGEVARTVIAAGADIINDVTAISDPVLGQVVAEAQVPIVLMHLRGTLPEIQHLAQYDDVVLEVLGELREAVDRAEGYGIRQDRILLDPGIGFAKDDGHNLALLKGLSELRALGYPLLVGASRKRFIGALTGVPPSIESPEA